MKLLNISAFLSKLQDFLEEDKRATQNAPEAPTDYVSRSIFDTFWRDTANKHRDKVLELMSKPVDRILIDDITLGRVLHSLKADLSQVEYGSRKWHYLTGKIEGLEMIYKAIETMEDAHIP